MGKTVIVLGTGKLTYLDTIANFHSFYSTDRHNGMGKSSVQLIKNRIAETSRNIFDPAFNDSACTVLIFQTFFQICGGFFSSSGIKLLNELGITFTTYAKSIGPEDFVQSVHNQVHTAHQMDNYQDLNILRQEYSEYWNPVWS